MTKKQVTSDSGLSRTTPNLSKSFAQLKVASDELGTASDQLGMQIDALESILKSLNLGVSGWMPISQGKGWSRDLGYAKVGNRWGLALRQTTVGETTAVQWKFNEGPRWLRLEAVPKLAGLLDHLVERTREMTVLAQKRAVEVEGINRALAESVADAEPPEVTK